MDATPPGGDDSSPRPLPDPADRLALLIEIGRVLAAAPDDGAGVDAAAQLLTPALSDVCLVDVLDERGALRPLARAHADPGHESIVAKLRLRWPPAWRTHDRPASPSQGGPAGVSGVGQALVLSEIDADGLRTIADSPARRLLRQVGLTSCLVMPLAVGVRVLGMLLLGLTGDRARYTDQDLPFAEEIGRRVALVVDAARHRRRLATLDRERTVLRSKYDQLARAARELSHALNNDLTLPIGALELLQDRADLAADVRDLMAAATTDLGAAEARVRAFHTLARGDAGLPDTSGKT